MPHSQVLSCQRQDHDKPLGALLGDLVCTAQFTERGHRCEAAAWPLCDGNQHSTIQFQSKLSQAQSDYVCLPVHTATTGQCTEHYKRLPSLPCQALHGTNRMFSTMFHHILAYVHLRVNLAIYSRPPSQGSLGMRLKKTGVQSRDWYPGHYEGEFGLAERSRDCSPSPHSRSMSVSAVISPLKGPRPASLLAATLTV